MGPCRAALGQPPASSWPVGPLTNGRGGGRGDDHAGAVVQALAIGAGADGAAGAQQAEPLALLTVTRVGHCGEDRKDDVG